MSLFSSLSYLLKRAVFALNQTVSTELQLNVEFKPANEVSVIGESKNWTLNTTNFSKYLHVILGAGNFSDKANTNNSFNLTTAENLTNFISLSKTHLVIEDSNTSESKFQFPNETYHDADLLLESWWNVFDERYLRYGWGWTATLIAAYMVILVVGVIGNIMVILVVLLRPQMRTVTNMFITNLAVADLSVIIFCVPSTLLANIFSPWILGPFMCKAVAYVQGVSVCASVYSLAAISLDRCQAVYRNYERPRGFSKKICVRTLLIIWTGAMCLTIPWAVVFEVKVSEYDGLRNCVEIWQKESHGNIYFIVVDLICFYAIPLLLVFVSNWIIYCHVMHRHVPQESASSAPLREMHRHTRHVVLRMLGIVTLTFFFSWLPLYVLVIVVKFSESISDWNYNILDVLMSIAQWLGSWNSCINPILYAFLNKKFRRMFKSILPAWVPVKSMAQSYQSSVRNPSFTSAAYTGRSLARSRANSRSECCRFHHQSGRLNFHDTAKNSVGRLYEGTGTSATTTVQIRSTIIPHTKVLLSGSLEKIVVKAVADKMTTETITDL